MSSRSWAKRFIRQDKLRFAIEEGQIPLGLRPGDRITIFTTVFLFAVVRRVSTLTGYVHWRTLAPRAHGWLTTDDVEGATFARGWLTSERDQAAFLAARALMER